jgi:hypothetical protein
MIASLILFNTLRYLKVKHISFNYVIMIARYLFIWRFLVGMNSELRLIERPLQLEMMDPDT